VGEFGNSGAWSKGLQRSWVIRALFLFSVWWVVVVDKDHFAGARSRGGHFYHSLEHFHHARMFFFVKAVRDL